MAFHEANGSRDVMCRPFELTRSRKSGSQHNNPGCACNGSHVLADPWSSFEMIASICEAPARTIDPRFRALNTIAYSGPSGIVSVIQYPGIVARQGAVGRFTSQFPVSNHRTTHTRKYCKGESFPGRVNHYGQTIFRNMSNQCSLAVQTRDNQLPD